MKKGWFERGAFTGDFLPKLKPHHRQEDLDGACGFYCLAMILDYFEIIDNSQARLWLARQLNSSEQSRSFSRGVYQKALQSLVQANSPLMLYRRSPRPIEFRSTRGFIEPIVGNAIPGILFYPMEDEERGYNHYAVSVGAGESKIFLMDPGREAVVGCLYDNYLEYTSDNRVLDLYGLQVTKIGTCMAISREDFEFDQKWRLPRSAG